MKITLTGGLGFLIGLGIIIETIWNNLIKEYNLMIFILFTLFGLIVILAGLLINKLLTDNTEKKK